MITLQLDKAQLASNFKAVTAASDESWGNSFRQIVNVVATAIAFAVTVGLIAMTAYKHPVASLKAWTNPPTPNTPAVAEVAAAPVKEKPKTRPASKPRPAALKVISEKLDTSTTSKRAPRTRKKKALTTA